MSQQRSKFLEHYKVLEAFVQCDFLDGFSYIDKAGEIVNIFVREKKEIPKFTMALDGLAFENVSENIREARISSTTIWLHIVDPKNLGEVENEAKVFISKILKILKPSIYKRIGWRTFFAREVTTKNLKVKDSIGSYDLQNLTLSKKLDNFQVRFEISPLASTQDPDKQAMLFDVDIAKEAAKFEITDELKAIRETIRSDQLLGTFEELLEND